jgi:hypothetical protein
MAGNPNWKPGQSGNPSGRPKIPSEIREMARAASPAALQALVDIVNDRDSPPPARVSAANSILDRAYGKPAQPIDGDGEGGAIPMAIEVRFVSPGES